MKNKGFILGWIVGMILQLIFAPLIFDDFINKGWWIVQLIGLTIVIILSIVFDKKLRKLILSWFKNIDWSNIGENLIELSKFILVNIDKYLCKLWDIINRKSNEMFEIINKWIRS